jgi:hypothetical protein
MHGALSLFTRWMRLCKLELFSVTVFNEYETLIENDLRRSQLIYRLCLPKVVRIIIENPCMQYKCSSLSAFRDRGVPKPTSEMSPRAPAHMGRREAEREGGK